MRDYACKKYLLLPFLLMFVVLSGCASGTSTPEACTPDSSNSCVPMVDPNPSQECMNIYGGVECRDYNH